jgi:hypothetical protein
MYSHQKEGYPLYILHTVKITHTRYDKLPNDARKEHTLCMDFY